MATCGIYKITNMVNGKVYIGQSVDIEKRWNEHKRDKDNKRYKEYNKPLYRAMRKYGLENFSFEIILECEDWELDGWEEYYIFIYNAYAHNTDSNGYNLTFGGEGNRGYVPSEEIRRMLSEKAKLKIGEKNPNWGNHKLAGENNPMWGKQHSEETKQKIREKAIGRKWSEESRKKASETHKGMGIGSKNNMAKGVVCRGIYFGCVKDCSIYFDKNYSTMSGWLTGKAKMPQEYIDLGLRYATQEENDFYKEIQQIKMLNKKIDI